MVKTCRRSSRIRAMVLSAEMVGLAQETRKKLTVLEILVSLVTGM